MSLFVVLTTGVSFGAVSASQEIDFGSLTLKGWAGERMAACERNLVAAKNADDLAFPFTQKTESGSWNALEPGIWQTEFWGKWMHAAVPVCVEGSIPFFDTMPPDASMHLGVTALLKTGSHDHPPRPIGFCDFASAGNTDDRRSFYRVWLPARQ